MGAHKYNPVAIAAAKGELPPKPPKKSKRQVERELYAMCAKAVCAGLIKTMQKDGELYSADNHN